MRKIIQSSLFVWPAGTALIVLLASTARWILDVLGNDKESIAEAFGHAVASKPQHSGASGSRFVVLAFKKHSR